MSEPSAAAMEGIRKLERKYYMPDLTGRERRDRAFVLDAAMRPEREMADALSRYTKHHPKCDSGDGFDSKCTCGLTAVFDQLYMMRKGGGREKI